MDFGTKIFSILWILTGFFLIVLVGTLVGLSQVVKETNDQDAKWTWGRTEQVNTLITNSTKTQMNQIEDMILDENDFLNVNVENSLRPQQVALPGVKTFNDLLSHKDSNIIYDLKGQKAPVENKISFEGNDYIVYELKSWPLNLTDNAKRAQNAQAAISLVFVLLLSASIFTTIGVSVYQKNKKVKK